MGTLMTVFSGVAALMCLLVGLQLLVLESRIGLAPAQLEAGSTVPFQQWKAEAHTGAVMALGAGVLIFLFGLRQRMIVHAQGKGRNGSLPADLSVDVRDSLSVRVFEVDAADRTVEISPEAVDSEPVHPAPPPRYWAPLGESEPGPDDPTDSILRSIAEATSPSGQGRSRLDRRSWWSRHFGRRRRR